MQSLSLIDMIANAGLMVKFVMFLLLGFSIGSWTIIFMKFKLFKEVREDSGKFLQTFWRCKSLADAQVSAKASQISPEAAIFNMGYTELRRMEQGRAMTQPGEKTLDMRLASMDHLKRTLRKAENLESARLGKSLAFLATTGSSTPFIGLFGTVWGIMASFHDIGMRGSASLAVVAPGISEALVATAAGLAVAIPAVIFYNHYSNQLADLEGEMQNFSADFLNLVEREFFSQKS